MVDQSKLTSISNWLIAGAQPPKDIEGVIEECARRLNEAGIPLDAMNVSGLFIHPRIRGIQIRWSRKKGIRRVTFEHEYFETRDYDVKPVARSISSRRSIRANLVCERPASDVDEDYAEVHRRSGYTDVLVLPLFNFDGTVNGCIEFATKSEDGFGEDHITALRRIQSPLARMKEYFTERYDKQITLATYVGEATSRKVLDGRIVRGSGETISAVVLFADIKGFTRLSNSMESADVLHLLNRFFAEVDAAVSVNNGEILKFLGDGVLVIFPTPDDLTAQEAAAHDALAAVVAARNALKNETLSPNVEFRAALHVGDLFYGNIGSHDRLDFTAIGPAVNLCSRMLHEASLRDVPTMCSEQFMTIADGVTGTPLTCEVAGYEEPMVFLALSEY